MDPSSKDERKRIAAESRAHVLRALESNDDSNKHVLQSREAIGRSLRLLGQRFSRLDR